MHSNKVGTAMTYAALNLSGMWVQRFPASKTQKG